MEALNVLIVEDNLGDFILIRENIEEEFVEATIHHVSSFAELVDFFKNPPTIDAILLDLSLPDGNGHELVSNTVKLVGNTPILVLTGYADKEFGIKTLSLGVSDFLLKDELNASQLIKSITYSIERRKIALKLRESVNRYNNVAKATSDAIWDYDFATQQTFIVGQGYKNLFGYNIVDGFTPRFFWESKLHPAEKEAIIKEFNEILSSPTNAQNSLEYRFQRSDGSYAHILDRFFIIYENGQITRIIGAMQDISKLKNEQQQLKLLSSVITNANDSVTITDADLQDNLGPKIVYVNKAFTQMSGYTSEEVIGLQPFFLQKIEGNEAAIEIINAAMQQGSSCETQIMNRKKNGESYGVAISISPVTDNNGTLTNFIAIEKDITERMKYIQAIELQNEKLREIAWTQSHIVRAPIARMMGLIDILQNHRTMEMSQEELLNYIANSANELDVILKDIVKKAEQVTTN
ncbi:MAG: PAS domain S-box protein [Chitinophagaceae bacterium]